MGTRTIELGAMSPSLVEQLADTGIPTDDLDTLDRDSKAISRLYIRDLITETEAMKARKRLMKKIQTTLDKLPLNQEAN